MGDDRKERFLLLYTKGESSGHLFPQDIMELLAACQFGWDIYIYNLLLEVISTGHFIDCVLYSVIFQDVQAQSIKNYRNN